MIEQPQLILKEIQNILSLDPYVGSFDGIHDRVRKLSHNDRRRLLALCDKIFSTTYFRGIESARVAAAKCMVALIPDSVSSIRRWVRTTTERNIREVHFSLFCFLDHVQETTEGGGFAKEIPSLVEKYLLTIKSESAHAAFMAGDLLGDHWNTPEALPVLARLAKQARFAVGRDSAVHGLARVLTRVSAPRDVQLISSLLADIAESDRSKKVRACAALALKNRTS